MKLTQRLIIILGDTSLITNDGILKCIAGFKAVTIIKTLTEEMLNTVYHYNKNAVYFSTKFAMDWMQFDPVVIQLSTEGTILDKLVLGIDNIIQDFPKLLDQPELAYIDVGDHSSADSTGMVNQSTDDCLLCQIYRHKAPHEEHIVYETDNFYVVPGTGAFFDGYLMIVPKAHVMSFGLLDETVLTEFYRVLNDVRSILEGIYHKKVFAFECASGRTGAGKHKTSIVHAHFHLAPTDMPVLKEVLKSGLSPVLIQKEDLHMYGENPYMLYVDQEDNWFMACDPNTYYPRQQPRQVLATYMGDYEHYNWRIYPYREKMPIIAQKFRDYCAQNFKLLPKWIRESVVFDD